LLLYQEILKNRKEKSILDRNFLVLEITFELKEQHYKTNTRVNGDISPKQKNDCTFINGSHFDL